MMLKLLITDCVGKHHNPMFRRSWILSDDIVVGNSICLPVYAVSGTLNMFHTYLKGFVLICLADFMYFVDSDGNLNVYCILLI